MDPIEFSKILKPFFIEMLVNAGNELYLKQKNSRSNMNSMINISVSIYNIEYYNYNKFKI